MNDPVLDRMQEEMSIRGHSPRTIQAYVGALSRFQRVSEEPLDGLRVEKAREHLIQLKKAGRSASTLNQAQCAFKFLFLYVLRQPVDLGRLPGHKRPRRLPVILSKGQVRDLIINIANPKHRMVAMVLYSGGLRLREATRLKPHDIDSQRMRIVVRGGKGNKDREVVLAQKLLEQLRNYYVVQRPKEWLFPGKDSAKPMDERGIQKAIKKAARQAGIRKTVSPHVLRHCFATHALESGTPLPYIQRMLGHSSIQTTMVYLKVTSEGIDQVMSPLDQLGL